MKIEGLKELNDRLMDLHGSQRGRPLRDAIKRAAEPVVTRAKSNIPKNKGAPHKVWRGSRKNKDSGWLVSPGFAQRSIAAVTRLAKSKNAAATFVGVLKPAFYAVQFVERGTSRTPKQEWLKPALEDSQGESLRILEETLRTGIEKEAKRIAREIARRVNRGKRR